MAGRDAATAARRVLVALGIALALAGPAGAAEPASLPDLEDEVMCVECGTALNISESAVADDEREFIRGLIAQGRSKQEIKDALVTEYGPNVLATPRSDGFGLAAYVVPPLLALLALGGVLVAGRRWRGRERSEPAGPPALKDFDTRRLDRDMADYDL